MKTERVDFLVVDFEGRTQPNFDDQLLVDAEVERQSLDVERRRLRRSIRRADTLSARLEARYHPL